MEWITNHFTKEHKLHGWEMLVLRIEVWLTLMGLALYGLVVVALPVNGVVAKRFCPY